MKRILVFVLLAWASLLSAQTRRAANPASPSASRLVSIRVTGSTRYAPAQIVAASGLQLGQAVNEDEFKGVSQHLGETGAFDNVAYTFEFDSAGIKLELQVADAGPFVPVRFENFVWLSNQELLEKLSAREPLFQKAQLPVRGNLADQVSDALQALAIEHNVHGRVDYLRAGPQDGPTEAFEFSITGQAIGVRKMEFTGASPAEMPFLQAAARKLVGQDYSRSRLALQAEKNFLPFFLEHGYLKAAIAEPQPKVVEETPEETVVDVTFPITPGPQFKLGTVQLSGYSNVFPVDKLRELIHLQPGHTVDALEIAQDMQALKSLYGTRGYMGVQIQLVPEMNDTESTVNYTFQFKEGGIYKMGDLEVHGLDSKAVERIGEAWKLLTGQNYDSAYPRKFVDSISNLFPPDQWKILIRETPDEQDKHVDVALHFDAIR